MIDQIKELIAQEIGFWNRLRSEAEPEEKVKIDGAISELLMYAGHPEEITSDYLRERYRQKQARIKNPEIKNRELDLLARNRAVKAKAAIERLGKAVAAIDKTTTKEHSVQTITTEAMNEGK